MVFCACLPPLWPFTRTPDSKGAMCTFVLIFRFLGEMLLHVQKTSVLVGVSTPSPCFPNSLVVGLAMELRAQRAQNPSEKHVACFKSPGFLCACDLLGGYRYGGGKNSSRAESPVSLRLSSAPNCSSPRELQ